MEKVTAQDVPYLGQITHRTRAALLSRVRNTILQPFRTLVLGLLHLARGVVPREYDAGTQYYGAGLAHFFSFANMIYDQYALGRLEK